MIKVTVNGRAGKTTSLQPYINGKYLVWFDDSVGSEWVEKDYIVFV
jgi:hypothetical protein